MTNESHARHHERSTTRRAVLKAAGGAGAALLTAHPAGVLGQSGRPEATPASSRTPLATSSPVAIYDSGAALPTESVTFAWLETGTGPRTVFMEDLFALYQEVHPNITIQYDHLPVPATEEALSIAIQADTLPDVFDLTAKFPSAQAVGEGWVAPLDDIIPNFADWKAAFPQNTFFEGINVFNGKTYTFPISTNQWLTAALLYNEKYMQEAGYDPASAPLTWDEFRDAARKITEAGQGQYYGLIVGGKQTGRWSQIISQFAELAGAPGGEFNWGTGEFNYTTDEFAAAIELILAINADGSIFPGSLQLSASAAREQFPQGVAGIILQGQWNIPQWSEGNPEFGFDVGFQPVADPETTMKLTYGPGGANTRWVSASSQTMAVAGDILHYLGTLEGQIAWGTHTRGSDPPLFPAAREASADDPRMQRVNKLTTEWMRLAPDPAVRNPDVAQVSMERQRLTPNLGEIVQGLIVGQLQDVGAAMQDLQDRADQELDAAIESAQANGADVSRDDWVFPNWDPTRDYTEEDYKALT